jgi:hypothetical protein
MNTFYILSFSRQGKDPELCFWRPGAYGYTTNVLEAGVYTREEVIRNRHHDGPNAVALPQHSLPLLCNALHASFERQGYAMPPRMVVKAMAIPNMKASLLTAVKKGLVLVDRGPYAGMWKWAPLDPAIDAIALRTDECRN